MTVDKISRHPRISGRHRFFLSTKVFLPIRKLRATKSVFSPQLPYLSPSKPHSIVRVPMTGWPPLIPPLSQAVRKARQRRRPGAVVYGDEETYQNVKALNAERTADKFSLEEDCKTEPDIFRDRPNLE